MATISLTRVIAGFGLRTTTSTLGRSLPSAARPRDKERVAKEAEPFGADPKFPGFDGNNESAHLSIAHFLVDEMKRFARFKDRDADLNSKGFV